MRGVEAMCLWSHLVASTVHHRFRRVLNAPVGPKNGAHKIVDKKTRSLEVTIAVVSSQQTENRTRSGRRTHDESPGVELPQSEACELELEWSVSGPPTRRIHRGITSTRILYGCSRGVAFRSCSRSTPYLAAALDRPH